MYILNFSLLSLTLSQISTIKKYLKVKVVVKKRLTTQLALTDFFSRLISPSYCSIYLK